MRFARQPRADRLAEGAARGRRPPAGRRATSAPTSSRSTTTCGPTTTPTSPSTSRRATGPGARGAGRGARLIRRADLLDADDLRRGRRAAVPGRRGVRRLCQRRATHGSRRAFDAYLETIPDDKRFDRDLFYEVRDVVGKSGFGIGSAGLPAYNVLVEGYSQALDNDVVLSMKQANVPALSRFVDSREIDALLRARGTAHRGQPARAAGPHRPAARLHRPSTGSATSSPRSRRTRSTWTGAASTSPTRSPRSSTSSAGPPPRSTAPPTRTASRTSSTSRSRRRSRPASRGGARSSPSTSSSSRCPTPCRCARTTRSSSTPSARRGSGSARPERPEQRAGLGVGLAELVGDLGPDRDAAARAELPAAVAAGGQRPDHDREVGPAVGPDPPERRRRRRRAGSSRPRR